MQLSDDRAHRGRVSIDTAPERVGLEDLADGPPVHARRLLVTAGLVDELPDVPGVAERWGRDVLHCPYCHGWEVRDQAIGVLATGPSAMHQTLLFRQLNADVTLFLHTAGALDDEQAEQLAARGVNVVTGEVVGLEVTDDRLTGVRLSSGQVVPRPVLVVAPGFAGAQGIGGTRSYLSVSAR